MAALLYFAALGKSAQFPFINWPARAMEGPTPSSAIFYGALSIHSGLFLLYRTYPLWSFSSFTVYLITAFSIITILLATIVGRVQSNIKGQLAYASVVQISIMFIELAWGYKDIVLIHLTCHCLLRCYQLLTSPSSVVDYVKLMELETTKKKRFNFLLPEKMKNTFFSFAFQEAFLSNSERGFFPFPMLILKRQLRRLAKSYFFVSALIILAIFLAYGQQHSSEKQVMAYTLSALDLFLSFNCLMSLERPHRIWNKFLIAQFLFFASAFLFEYDNMEAIFIYAASALPCWYLGKIALSHLQNVDMKKYNGLHIVEPKKTLYFLISFVGLSGLPFTTTFWAEEIIFSEMLRHAPALLIITCISLTLNGLISARILVKTFWGFPSHITY